MCPAMVAMNWAVAAAAGWPSVRHHLQEAAHRTTGAASSQPWASLAMRAAAVRRGVATSTRLHSTAGEMRVRTAQQAAAFSPRGPPSLTASSKKVAWTPLAQVCSPAGVASRASPFSLLSSSSVAASSSTPRANRAAGSRRPRSGKADTTARSASVVVQKSGGVRHVRTTCCRTTCTQTHRPGPPTTPCMRRRGRAGRGGAWPARRPTGGAEERPPVFPGRAATQARASLTSSHARLPACAHPGEDVVRRRGQVWVLRCGSCSCAGGRRAARRLGQEDGHL